MDLQSWVQAGRLFREPGFFRWRECQADGAGGFEGEGDRRISAPMGVNYYIENYGCFICSDLYPTGPLKRKLKTSDLF